MSPVFRPGSFLSRLESAGRYVLGVEKRGYPPPNIETVFSQGFGLPPTFDAIGTQKAYAENPWLFSAVNVIAHEGARTTFRLYKPKKDGDLEEVRAHQALETLARPQPVDGGKTMLTRYQLFFLLCQHLMLNGEGFWALDERIRVSGAPTLIAPLNPANVYETLNSDGTINKYVYRFLGGPWEGIQYDAADVVHFKFPSPSNWIRGQSPVQPIQWAVATYKEADVLNTKSLANNAVPRGTLETDKNPSDADREKLKNQWKQTYGGPENAGKVAMLPNGFKFNPIQMSNQEMQFVEGKNLTRDEILANYRVGLEMFGRTENQTRANADAAIYVFQKFTVLPVLEMIADTLTNDFLPAFPKTDGMIFKFDDPVPENEENKRSTADTLFKNGAGSPNEIRKMFGLDPINKPGMDETYVPFNAMPVGSSAPPPLELANTNK